MYSFETISPTDTIILYGEPSARVKIEYIDQQDELVPGIKSYIWNGEVESSNLTETTDLPMSNENQMYRLPVSYRHSSTEYYFNALQAPAINFIRSSYQTPNGSYGFDNYDYEAHDASKRFYNDYYLDNINNASYRTPWLTSKSGSSVFQLDATIPFKAENRVYYTLSKDGVYDVNRDLQIQKGSDISDIVFDFTQPTGSFQRVEIFDRRGQVKGQIMIATNSGALVEKSLTPVVVKTSRGSTSVPSDFRSQLNERSFNQAFFEWKLLDEKLLDVAAMFSKYTLTNDQKRILESNSLSNAQDIENYTRLIMGEYEAVHGIPEEDKPVVIFSDVVAERVAGRHITLVDEDAGIARYYIFYFAGARSCTWTHELGHNLGFKHTFEEGVTERKTKNFMDYGNDRYQFWKWQWFNINEKLEIE